MEKPSEFLTRQPELLAVTFALKPQWAQQWGNVEEQNPAMGPGSSEGHNQPAQTCKLPKKTKVTILNISNPFN